jgi:hypothetical protein
MESRETADAINSLRVEFATLAQTVRGLREDVVGRLQRDVSEIRRLQESSFVTNERFEAEVFPLKKIVYTVVATFGLAILGAVLRLVIIQ